MLIVYLAIVITFIFLGNIFVMIDFVKGYLDLVDNYRTHEEDTDYDWFPNDPDEGNCNSLQGTLLNILWASVNGIPDSAAGWFHRMGNGFFEK